VLDVGGLTTLADYFVICTGNTDRQVKAIADEVDEAMRASYREHPHHVEGLAHCRWVLMDYSDVIVHVFERETREYYNLDGLWADAPVVEI
jgi:ribosome-associated protein